jgi:hypothetical protein
LRECEALKCVRLFLLHFWTFDPSSHEKKLHATLLRPGPEGEAGEGLATRISPLLLCKFLCCLTLEAAVGRSLPLALRQHIPLSRHVYPSMCCRNQSIRVFFPLGGPSPTHVHMHKLFCRGFGESSKLITGQLLTVQLITWLAC